jgi:carbohydrate kinase (thermoresistant glucokinase family)
VVVIILGVSAAGKTTVGELLAQELGWAFYEGDDLHSPANVEKMHAGIPLTDEDRWPWLESLRELVKRCLAKGENAILACSALKKAYRRHLRVNSEVNLVYLRGDFTLIANQVGHRHAHFMNPALLRSQFADLEEPQPAEGVLTIQLGRAPHELVEEIKTKLRLTSKN